MRKLSKKISMLMVLAMLVSLFSGVVSASAASSWTFFNKTKEDSIVAQSKTETYKMENNEFADFDMFKDGKTIDTKVYTVKYGSSDADVVFVDAKNGKLRAKGEAGESAKVTAYITNKNTGAKAQRWFVIEIVDGTDYAIVADFADEVVAVGEKLALAATVTADGEAVEAKVAFTLDGAAITEFVATEAGDYTIVATATIDGEVVATEKFVVVAEVTATEIEAVQTSLNAVVLTFNNASAAAKAVADASLITADYVINDLVVASPVRSVAAVEGDALSVTVTLYNNIIKDLKHTFYYNNDEASDSVIGAESKPAYIKVIGATYEYQTQKDLVVKVFNAQNVDITADADVANKVTWSADLSEDFSITTNGKIFFYNADKAASVKAVYDMGLNDNYEENPDLEATGIYYSVKTPDVAYAPHGYRINGSNTGFSLNPIKVAVNDNAFTLDIQYKYKQGTNWPADHTITGAGDDAGLNFSYKYYSSNKAVVMVGENNGLITPVAPGSTTVYVKRVDGNNNNAETTICVIPVTVDGKRALSTFNVAVDGSNKLSVNANGTDTINSLTLKYTAKDLLGADYEDPAKVSWSYKFTYPNALKDVPLTGYFTEPDVKEEANQIALDVDYTNDELQDYLNTVCVNGKNYETFKIEVTATDTDNNNAQKKFEVTFLAKVIDTTDANAVKNRVLSWSKANIDMKLSNENAGNYATALKLVKTDSDGFYIGDETLTSVANKAQVTSGNGYCVILKKNGNVEAFGAMNGSNTAYEVSPVTVTANKITKMDKGTYVAELYKADAQDNVQSLGVKTLVLTDSTAATSVTLKKDTLASYAPTVDQLKDSITFLRGGKDINNYIAGIVTCVPKQITDGHLYIDSVTLMVKADEIADNWNDAADGDATADYTEVTFNVNKLFTYQP